jgi:hypothetical protein
VLVKRLLAPTSTELPIGIARSTAFARSRTRPDSAIGTLAGTGLIASSGWPPAVLTSAALAGRAIEHRS